MKLNTEQREAIATVYNAMMAALLETPRISEYIDALNETGIRLLSTQIQLVIEQPSHQEHELSDAEFLRGFGIVPDLEVERET